MSDNNQYILLFSYSRQPMQPNERQFKVQPDRRVHNYDSVQPDSRPTRRPSRFIDLCNILFTSINLHEHYSRQPSWWTVMSAEECGGQWRSLKLFKQLHFKLIGCMRQNQKLWLKVILKYNHSYNHSCNHSYKFNSYL